MSAPVREGALYSPARENPQGAGQEAEEKDWDSERNVNNPRAPARAGPALLTATIAVSLISALFGADAVAVLAIAVLGATAALIATLSSLTTGAMERLSLFGDVLRRRGRRQGPAGSRHGGRGRSCRLTRR